MAVVKVNTGERPHNQDAWDRGLRFKWFIVMIRQGFVCLFFRILKRRIWGYLYRLAIWTFLIWKCQMHQNGTLAIWGSAVCNLYFSFPPSFKLALGSMKHHWLELGLAFLHPRPRLRTTAKGFCSHFVPCEGAFGTYLPESSEGASYWTRNHRDLRGCWQRDKPSCHQSEIPVVLGQFPKTSQAEEKKKKKVRLGRFWTI